MQLHHHNQIAHAAITREDGKGARRIRPPITSMCVG